MRKKLFGTRRRKVAVVIVVALVAASAALAAWLTTVQNPPARGQFQTLVVGKASPLAAPGATCRPASTCDGAIRLNNTTGAPMTLKSFTAGSLVGDSATINGGNGSCIEPDITSNVSIPAKTGLSIEVPVGPTDITIPGLFSIGSGVPSACAGADFTYQTEAGSFVVTLST